MRMRIVIDLQHNAFFVYLADADADAVEDADADRE